ncbi:ABC transporter substrate-binding protein [Microbacterium horticulturae]|uniref:ABC transporter substrate-binding protein n=1 Tax=Microbacterium horticulturae TaxID=3028316 RepID=A0ABY8BZC3_9MICO|nr:ABC transporter substrate-binding protein [Microbacterium sp. KACC 23027]WEG07948.1 ABC transporter substrate-binding protein [Microbacterium sp. KACC 23027]
MRRHLTGAIALAAAATLALTACSGGGSSAEKTGTAGGTLTILTSATQIDLDPAKSQNLAITTLGLIERRLTTWDIEKGKDPKVVPDLATDTGTVSDDGKTWTYTLKDGLKFADGTPITSEDVKYGIERSFAPELSGGLGYHKSLLVGGEDYQGPYTDGDLDSIETPDDKTIVFHLNASYGDWPWIVSMPAFAPVPKDKDDPKTYGQDPVATGPYKVSSNKQGTALELVRNTNWDKSTDPVRTAGPDKIIFKESQDVSTSTQSLISDAGSAKTSFLATYLGAAELALVNKNPSAKERLATSDAGPISYLAMNTQRGALKDLKVRQAIEYAVDPKAFIIAQGGSQAAIRATTLITPGIPGRQEYDLYPSGDDGDVAKAKQLLKEAGHADDLKLTLWAANDPSNQAQAQALEQGIERAGIDVTIKPLDVNTMYTDATGDDPDYDLILGGWQPDFPSANGNIQPLFDSSQVGGGGYNLARYSSPEVDKLIDQATAATDPAQAQSLWAQADKRIMQDAPVVPLTYAKQSFLAGSDVENFFIASFPAYPNYLTVTLKQ